MERAATLTNGESPASLQGGGGAMCTRSRPVGGYLPVATNVAVPSAVSSAYSSGDDGAAVAQAHGGYQPVRTAASPSRTISDPYPRHSQA